MVKIVAFLVHFRYSEIGKFSGIQSMFKQLRNAARVVAGSLCAVVGVVGLFLPILPGTPFLLLAASCFSSLEA
jgi:hypothetical protein